MEEAVIFDHTKRIQKTLPYMLGILLLTGVLAACGGSEPSQRGSSASPTSNPILPTNTLSPIMEEAPRQDPTATAGPPIEFLPTGALLIRTDAGVGIIRPNSASSERLIEGCGNRFGESISGLAPFTTSKSTGDGCDISYEYDSYYYDQRLFVIASPEYSIREITPLLSYYDMAANAATMLDVPDELLYASIANAWSVPAISPDGRYLAFTAAIDGPSSDLYLYDFELDQIERKSSGANQAMDPIWSPDSSGVLHYEYIFGPSNFDRFLYAPVALWWAPAGSGSLQKMSEGDYPRFWGWLDDTHFVVWHSDLSGPLGIGDTSTGETSYLLERVDRAETLKTAQGGYVLAAVSEETQPDRLVMIDGSTESILEIPLQVNSSSLAIQAVDSVGRFLLASYQAGLAWITPEAKVITLDASIRPTQIFLSPDERKAIVGGSNMDPLWLYVFDEHGNLVSQFALPDHTLDWQGRSWRRDSALYVLDCDESTTRYIQQPEWEVRTVSMECPLWIERQTIPLGE